MHVLVWQQALSHCAASRSTWQHLMAPALCRAGSPDVHGVCSHPSAVPTYEDDIAIAVQELVETISWLEADKADDLARRNRRCDPIDPALAPDAIFCMESCCVAFYWSCIAYSYHEEVRPPLLCPAVLMDLAMQMLCSCWGMTALQLLVMNQPIICLGCR